MPPAIALLVPTLFIPISVDAYVLPRASLGLAGGGLLMAAGLVAGRRSLGALRLPVLAVAVAAVVAAAFSVAPSVSLVGTYGRYESLPMRLAYLGLFCGAVWVGERERTMAAFVVGCALAAVEALFQAMTHALPRADGNLGQPNLLGALLAMAVPLALDMAWRRSRPARFTGHRPRWTPEARAWLALAVVCGGGLAVSTSRSGWLGALAGICVLAVFAARPKQLPGALAATALALAIAAGLVLISPLRNLNSDPPGFRLGIWRDSISVIAERPVTGWGPDTMGLVFGRHQTADWVAGSNIDRAHSMPLDLTATQGMLGLAACAWLFGVWWLGMWRGRVLPGTAGLAGAAAAYLTSVLLNFDWAPAAAAFWLLAGAGWAGPPGTSQVMADASPVRTVAATGIATVALFAALVPMAADLWYYAGRPDQAAVLDPWQPRYLVAQGSLASLRRAAALGDPDPSTYVALGDAEAEAGHRDAATAAYRQALERYPYDVEARQRLGRRLP